MMCLLIPNLDASYAVPVRQYRILQSGFLQPPDRSGLPCHLLTVRGVTPARKGLAPSGKKQHLSLLINQRKLLFSIIY